MKIKILLYGDMNEINEGGNKWMYEIEIYRIE